MSNKSIDKKLKGLLVENIQGYFESTKTLFRENRIYTNRNIKMSRIQAVGFDMDYTLAEYQQEALDQLTMTLALRHLVKTHGYPEDILDIPFKSEFAIRGLAMDKKLGNVLKMDKFRYVSLAYHGLRQLEGEKRAELYNAGRISFNDNRYRSVDTLFEILEAYLYAALIDHFEYKKGQKANYREIYEHLRGAIDLCHRDGSLKKEIMAAPGTFLKNDTLLIPMLHMLKESGKRLFVLTNSEPEYTDFVLNYLFRNSKPFFKDWRSCFEIVCAASRKPSFFTEKRDPVIIEQGDCLYFHGGNLGFLEKRLGANGDEVLYVGDHIYGDILKTKHTSSWRTCIIVPELDFQIRAEETAKPFLKKLMNNESKRKQINMELHWRRGQIFELQQFKDAESDELSLEHLQTIDDRLIHLNRKLEQNHQQLTKLLDASKRLRRKINNIFNPYWGRLFKTGDQLSIFAEQVRDYACLYTSKVSNLNFYGAHSYHQSMSTPMPHEDDLYPVGDLNFDVSMEGSESENAATSGEYRNLTKISTG